MPTGDPPPPPDRSEHQAAYLPLDRRRALATGVNLPERAAGSALFADISGFTALTNRLTESLGLRRGAEELPRHLDLVYEALISTVHALGGSVISFSGDAITCWFHADDGTRAAACGSQMQSVMQQFADIQLPDGSTATLTLKVAVAAGEVSRWVVGDPEVQLLDVIAGETLQRLAATESVARPGEVVLDQRLAHLFPHTSLRTGAAVLTGPVAAAVKHEQEPHPGGDLSSWLLREVNRRLIAGQGEFLTELRPVTALFIGFDGIDYDHDEQAGAKLDAFVRRVQAETIRLEGSLLQLTVGDKGSYLYVAFGAPVAHEDDPRRAVTVARRLQSARADFPFLNALRMGLSHGTMRTGAYGGHNRRTYGALGHETNMAARLMSLAAPGQILATDTVLPHSGFSWRALPPKTVKGRSRKLTPYEPIAEQAAEVTHEQALLGRHAELEQLRGLLLQAASGEGQQLFICGDAGSGKSRLITELRKEARGFLVLSGEAEALQADTTYHPWQQVYASLLGEEPLSRLPDDLKPRYPLLAPVLQLNLPDNPLTASLDPELRKAARETLLVELLRRATADRPVLLILENAQWFDPLSQNLLEAIQRVSSTLPLLILVTSRDEQPGALQLAPLSDEAARELLLSRLTGRDVGQDSIERILQQAEGNPYYLQQLADHVSDDPEGIDLPNSLHSLVLSRLDRLSELQQATLKAASVIGRRFALETLQGYHPALGGSQRVNQAAHALSQLRLLEALSDDWLFTQQITREVSYSSISFSTRAKLHGRLARYIEQHLVTDSQPMLDLLALHYSASDDTERQRHYLLLAGIAAQDSYANETALRWYAQLLPLLTEQERVPVLIRVAQVQMHLGRYEAAEASCRAALDSAEDALETVRALRTLGELAERQADYSQATDWLEQARSQLQHLDEPVELIQVLLAEGGNVLWQLGEYGTARERLQQALELSRSSGEERSEARALHGLANLELYQGDIPAARHLYETSLSIRRRLGDSLGIANALNNLGIIAASLEGTETAVRLFEESLALRRRIGDRAGTAVALNNVGYMKADSGQLEAAAELYEESLRLRRELGDRLGTAVTLNSLGQLHWRKRDPAAAAGCYRQSLELAHFIGNQREAAAAIAGTAALAAHSDPQHAVTLAGAARGLLSSSGTAAAPEVELLLTSAIDQAVNSLDAAGVDRHQLTGEQLAEEAAVNMALRLLDQLIASD